MKRYDLIVVGGVAAGIKAAAKARREKRDWKILIVTDDGDVSYAGCGLPYYLGGVIQTRDRLVIKTPDKLRHVNELEIMMGHRAVSLDRKNRTITIRNLGSGDEANLEYGKLFLATGASSIMPPIPGTDLEGVLALRTVTDADKIMKLICGRKGKAVIAGAGLIGIEMAENLLARGWEVIMVEMLPQILPPFDEDVALWLQRHIEKKGVRILTGAQVKAISKAGESLDVEAGNEIIRAEMVIMSVGVRPNSELAKAAGLELGARGAIRVDKTGRTSDPDIYASGDCATTYGIISGSEVWAPMGSTANKQARMAALALTGQNDEFPGVLGAMAVKIFDVSAAKTGLNVAESEKAGHDWISVLVPADDRAHYYPGSAKIAIKLVAERKTGRILGAQAYGRGTVDKPIDAFSVALTMKATVHDLANADFAYAPPFSTAINPVNLACQVMINKMQGKMEGTCCTAAYREVHGHAWDGLILDTREAAEFRLGTVPGALNIPLAELKARLPEIEKYRNKQILVVCNFGKNAYDGYLRLKHLGFKHVKILEGGTNFWPYELE